MKEFGIISNSFLFKLNKYVQNLFANVNAAKMRQLQ